MRHQHEGQGAFTLFGKVNELEKWLYDMPRQYCSKVPRNCALTRSMHAEFSLACYDDIAQAGLSFERPDVDATLLSKQLTSPRPQLSCKNLLIINRCAFRWPQKCKCDSARANIRR